ncbi:MAG: porin [Cyclobacteriaceae bacterium]
MRATLTITLICLTMSGLIAQEEARPQVNFSAYADAYYAHEFNKPADQNRPYVTQAVRHNEFNLNWLFIKAEYEDDKVRGSVGLQTGTYVQTNYAAEPNDLTRLIYDTYAGVKLGERVWLDAGVFGGHTGYESPLSIENEVFTRALATEYTPYYQTGVRLSAELTDQLSLTAVVLNGWQIISETNDAKSYGFNLTYAVSDRLTINYGNLLGNEGNDAIGKKYRIYNHFYTRYQVSDGFHLMLSLDHGSQEAWDSDEAASFFFATLIGGVKFSEKFDLGLRYEYVIDEDGILIASPGDIGFKNNIGSVSFNYRPQSNIAWRTEFRLATGDNDLYENEDGPTNGANTLMTGLAVKF